MKRKQDRNHPVALREPEDGDYFRCGLCGRMAIDPIHRAPSLTPYLVVTALAFLVLLYVLFF